ncbi:uncharacterized protein LOC110096792 [Dendrobium catenatum]|uniref:uncharacterized protein LOC110096792 n=1 Tax=Dendrobium catenatum TaxID=906689 RepID=UPI0009F67AFD|nr:uncharacterized protein LOC110096792 [Dendrobium catenatum]
MAANQIPWIVRSMIVSVGRLELWYTQDDKIMGSLSNFDMRCEQTRNLRVEGPLGHDSSSSNEVDETSDETYQLYLNLDGDEVGQFSWFNQRANDPIHLVLDRMLINDKWLESFPTSRYEVLPPSCSDHSPIVLHSNQLANGNHRFLFKNFWTKQEGFWADLMDIFSQPIRGNPILGLYNKLKKFKEILKGKDWTNSSLLSSQFNSLKEQQSCCLVLLNNDSQNLALNQRFKGINAQLADCSTSWTNWMLQRAKINWLSQGEDDLKFLYARVRRRNICSSKLVACDDPNDRINMVNYIIEHFEKLFNAPKPVGCCDPLPISEGNTIPSHLSSTLIAPITDEEIKVVIFHGNSNSTPGPDGFNFEFYKSTWLITGPLICKAVKSFFSKGYLPKFVKASAIAL